VPLRILVIDLSIGRKAEDLLVLVNPAFVERTGRRAKRRAA